MDYLKLRLMFVLIIGCSNLFGVNIQGAQDLAHLFPKSASEIQGQEFQVKKLVDDTVAKILAIPKEQRTFANTPLAIDRLQWQLAPIVGAWHTLNFLSPVAEVRKAAQAACLNVAKYTNQTTTPFSPQLFPLSKQLYNALAEYVDGNGKNEQLNTKQNYFLQELLAKFKRAGLDLPTDLYAQVVQLNHEINDLCQQFETNVNTDQTKIIIAHTDLDGLAQDFLSNLAQDGAGNYVLNCDLPTYTAVMKQCQNAATRQKMYHAFNQRAYPANISVLKQLIAKRDALAKLLGFDSYAHFDLSDQMAQTPEIARNFLLDVVQIAQNKALAEIATLTTSLPASVKLIDGKIAPWDMAFLQADYCKKHLDLDERKIAEYFPTKQTTIALLEIYEQFLGLRFSKVNVPSLWSDEVEVIAVYTADTNKLIGYVMLDLFPRPNKMKHGGAALMLVPTITSVSDLQEQPAVALVVANFPHASGNKPALLSYRQLSTFFHEFGHALHILLGKTEFALFAGYSVKMDFLEMPSQMLENWLEDPKILTQISSHYQTGESLPTNLISRLASLNKFNIGCDTLRQITFGLLSLDLFAAGTNKGFQAIKQSISDLVTPYLLCDSEDHDEANFTHLTTYGAKYYSYLWADVFAKDMFAHIKEHGLLDPIIGQEYVAKVLSQGGQKDPNDLLVGFLGRQHNNIAFKNDYL